jgi:hypothetical protein
MGETVGGEKYYHCNGNCYHRGGNPLRNIAGKLVRLQKFDVLRLDRCYISNKGGNKWSHQK